MRLVNIETKRPLVEFQGEKTIFYNKYLEQEMEYLGIPIPHGMRSFFEGKDLVYKKDGNFQKAFREIYYLTAMDPHLFKWME